MIFNPFMKILYSVSFFDFVINDIPTNMWVFLGCNLIVPAQTITYVHRKKFLAPIPTPSYEYLMGEDTSEFILMELKLHFLAPYFHISLFHCLPFTSPFKLKCSINVDYFCQFSHPTQHKAPAIYLKH